jgi:hypothetical protein
VPCPAAGQYGLVMRTAVPAAEAGYVVQLAQADAGPWGASCRRMGDLLALHPQTTSPAGWLDPHRQILMQATALLIYVVAHDRQADPAAVDAADLLAWLDAHPVSRPVRQSRRAAMAMTLLAAGHAVALSSSREDRRGWDTTDPVAVIWRAAVHEDDHEPTIDGTYGLTLEVGLQQLAHLTDDRG